MIDYNIDELINKYEVKKDSKTKGQLKSIFLVLSFFLLIIMFYSYISHFNIILQIVFLVGYFILLFISYIIIIYFFSLFKGGKFVKEMNKLIYTYRKDNDSIKLFNGLAKLENKPKTERSLNVWKLNIAAALEKSDKLEDALAMLKAVDSIEDAFVLEKESISDEILKKQIVKAQVITANYFNYLLEIHNLEERADFVIVAPYQNYPEAEQLQIAPYKDILANKYKVDFILPDSSKSETKIFSSETAMYKYTLEYIYNKLIETY